MLMLSRRRGEVIVIGTGADTIRVTVVEIRPNGQVRLGIEADKVVAIWREEIYPGPKQPEAVKP